MNTLETHGPPSAHSFEQQQLEQQQQRQRLRQVVTEGTGSAAVNQTVDYDFFTRVWEPQGHAFGD